MRLRPICCSGRDVPMVASPPLRRISGYSMKKPITERISMISNTFSSRVVSRPAIATISISVSQPAIHSAAIGLEGVRSIEFRDCVPAAARETQRGRLGGGPVSATSARFATRKYADAALRIAEFRSGNLRPIGAKDRRLFDVTPGRAEDAPGSRSLRNRRSRPMRILQPAEWSKPRGFSHGVAVEGPGRWVVLAGQTGGDEKSEYPSDMAGQVAVALRRSSPC